MITERAEYCYMPRLSKSVWLSLFLAVLSVTQAFGQQLCDPTISFLSVHYPNRQQPKMDQTWAAVLSVDASRCATTSGRFAILFTQSREIGLSTKFREAFTWKPGSVEISREFWAEDEITDYKLVEIETCPCLK
jgi:hypothetical protein